MMSSGLTQLRDFLSSKSTLVRGMDFERLLPDKIYTKILGHDLKDTRWKKVRVCNPEGPDTAQNAHFQLFYFIHNVRVVSFPFHTFRGHFAVLARCLLLSAAAPSSFPAWPLLK